MPRFAAVILFAAFLSWPLSAAKEEKSKAETAMARDPMKFEVTGVPKLVVLKENGLIQTMSFPVRIKNLGPAGVELKPQVHAAAKGFSAEISKRSLESGSVATAEITITYAPTDETTKRTTIPIAALRPARLSIDVKEIDVAVGLKARSDLVFEEMQIQTVFSLQPVWWLLYVSLGGAILIGIITAFRADAASSTWPPGASIHFSLDQSAGSMLAFAGTLAANLTALSGFPGAESHLSRGTYAALSVLFSALVLISPAVFQPAEGGRGRTGYYIAAMIFNLWGVMGQLGLGELLLDELAISSLLPRAGVCLLQSALLVLGVVVLANAFGSMGKQVKPEGGTPPAPKMI